MNNRTISGHELDFIGGTPAVTRFENEEGTRSIDILSVHDGYLKERSVYATIGLHREDTGLSVHGKPLRTELIFAALNDHELNMNILASAAFECMDRHLLKPGCVIHNVIPAYIKDTEVRHFVCMTPVFWERYSSLETDDEIAVWLQLVPVSDSELTFIEKEGLERFDRLLFETNTDITRLRRHSII